MENFDWRYQAFLAAYGAFPQWKSDTKDARKGIERMEKEIERLSEMEFPK